MKDIRYLQRFENFEKSFLLLRASLDIEKPSLLEKAGVIQFFETSFELAWKLMKDYLEYVGYDVKSPRDSIKTAFSIELVKDAQSWLDALMDRNLTTHTYDETIANEVYEKIKYEYIGLLEGLYVKFKDEICLD
ncbi:MAG: nucleotidyltransferase substrate binding protein [Sulfurimonas sp.]|nr:nucleotidyltransferase substrate binding protein [Sulfurimonas sp.]